jgi:hypothetical protein
MIGENLLKILTKRKIYQLIFQLSSVEGSHVYLSNR